MLALNRFAAAAAAAVLCSLASGCAGTPGPAPGQLAAGHSMTQEEMAQLGAQAEQEIAAGRLDSGGALYVRLLTAYPNNAPAWFRLGTVYLRSLQPEYAEQAFQQALRADPSLSKAHANLAMAHLYQFRAAATRAVASAQVPESNRLALQSLLRDVDHALAPAADTLVAKPK